MIFSSIKSIVNKFQVKKNISMISSINYFPIEKSFHPEIVENKFEAYYTRECFSDLDLVKYMNIICMQSPYTPPACFYCSDGPRVSICLSIYPAAASMAQGQNTGLTAWNM
jgi:hypothetical protein